MKVEIKPIGIEQLNELESISRTTFADTFAADNSSEDLENYLNASFNKEKLTEELSNPQSEFSFAYIKETPVGYLKINTGEAQTEIKNQNGLEIERIYVLEAYQGHKIGQALFSTVLERAEFHQVDFVWLGVWEKNEKAIRFYEKNGFIAFDKHVFVLGKDVQTDIMMKLTL